MRTHFQRRLVMVTMLTSTAVLVLTGATLLVYDGMSYRRALAEALDTRAAILGSNSAAALLFQNPEDATHGLGALKADPGMMAAALYDGHGRVFATYPAKAPHGTVPATAPANGHRFGPATLEVAEPVVLDGKTLGTVFLRSDLKALWVRQRVYALVVVVAVLGSLAVALALSTWLQKTITRPIRVLAAAAARVSEQKDYAVRAEVVSFDEFGRLTQTFNDMLQAIQERDREIRVLNADLEGRVAARTAELEATNRELEAFTYSVSHDLRAPLRHVAGFSDLLAKRAGDSLDEGARRYLDNIIGSATRMGHLIDDLLSFSRMARSELLASPVDLDQVVVSVIRELQPEVGERAVDWQVAAMPVVHADPAMMQVVLTNLLSNALKYTATRPQAAIAVDAAQEDGRTIVRVRDNGVGFDMAYRDKLFGVFQRLHRADEFEGTGIGLATVRRIVRRHGGEAWAESQLDAGATFYFSLPELKEAA